MWARRARVKRLGAYKHFVHQGTNFALAFITGANNYKGLVSIRASFSKSLISCHMIPKNLALSKLKIFFEVQKFYHGYTRLNIYAIYKTKIHHYF